MTTQEILKDLHSVDFTELIDGNGLFSQKMEIEGKTWAVEFTANVFVTKFLDGDFYHEIKIDDLSLFKNGDEVEMTTKIYNELTKKLADYVHI